MYQDTLWWNFKIRPPALTNHSHHINTRDEIQQLWSSEDIRPVKHYTCLRYGAITPISATGTAEYSLLVSWQQYIMTWTASAGLNHEGLWPSRVSVPCIGGKGMRWRRSAAEITTYLLIHYSYTSWMQKKNWNIIYNFSFSPYIFSRERVSPHILDIFLIHLQI